jgi:hypothetical protein
VVGDEALAGVFTRGTASIVENSERYGVTAAL